MAVAVAVAATFLCVCCAAWTQAWLIEDWQICSACEITAEEFLQSLDINERKHGKTMTVGSRLHDSGYDKRTYSLTETHVQDAIDDACLDLSQYGLEDDTRFVKLGGSGPITLKNFSSLSSRQIKDLRNAVRPHAVIWWTVFLASVVDSQHLRIV